MGSSSILAPNKLRAGNAGCAARSASIAAGQVCRAAGGEFLGKFSAAGTAWPIWSVDVGVRIGIGGFLRFRGGWALGVRMGKSECRAHRLDFVSFSDFRVQPDRLTARPLAEGQGGADPLRGARFLPIRVAHAGNRNGEMFPDQAHPRANGICQADAGAGNGREIPSILSGSGVRAAQCAGVNGRSVCRPKSRGTVGLGGGCSRSCANGVNELLTLGLGVGSVN